MTIGEDFGDQARSNQTKRSTFMVKKKEKQKEVPDSFEQMLYRGFVARGREYGCDHIYGSG